MLMDAFAELENRLLAAARKIFGRRLVALVVFGSVARGSPRFDSDLDVLLIVEDLPQGRYARMQEFAAVEDDLADVLSKLRVRGVNTEISAVLKTSREIDAGSPLLLDMVEDAKILCDRDGFFAKVLERLRGRLKELGARRVWRGNVWYWDLKPDYKPGEEFEL